MSSRRLTIALTLIGILAVPVASHAKGEWLLADQKDKEIRRYLELTLQDAADMFQEHGTEVVVVLDQVMIESTRDWHTTTRNMIWWIRSGEVPELTNWVRDYPPGEKVEEVAAFTIQPGRIDPQAALNAPIEKLEDARIQLQKGDDETRLSNLVVAFPPAQPGILLAISVRTKIETPLYWYTHVVKGPRPVARSEVRLKNSRYVTYLSAGQRFPKGQLKRKILEEKKGVVRDVVIYTSRAAPIHREPYAPPAALQSPRILIVLRSQHMDFGNGNELWWKWESWNQVAYGMDQQEIVRSQEMDRVAAEARRIQSSLPGGVDVRHAFYRFVRDELLPVDSYFFTRGDDVPSVDRILQNGSGSVADRSYVLVAMLRSVGIPALIAWAHDPDQGTLMSNYPNWVQVPHPLVVAGEMGDQVWLDVSCETCTPGDLRPRLRQTRAMVYDQGISAKHELLIQAAMDKAFLESLDAADTYFSMLRKAKWVQWIDTPGDLKRPVGRLYEELYVPGDGELAEYRLASTGSNRCRREWVDAGDVETFAEEWFARRFRSAIVGEVLGASPDRADTLRLALEVEPSPLPPPSGDTWVLPPEIVYGQPCVGVWPEDRKTGFYIRETQERTYTFRTPLPEEWRGAKLPSTVTIGQRADDPIYYTAFYRVQDGKLVIERSLRERSWYTTDERSLAILADRAEEIVTLETSPVVVERWDEAPTASRSGR